MAAWHVIWDSQGIGKQRVIAECRVLSTLMPSYPGSINDKGTRHGVFVVTPTSQLEEVPWDLLVHPHIIPSSLSPAGICSARP